MTLCQAERQAPFDHQPPRLPLPDPDPIRIYVACLKGAALSSLLSIGSELASDDTDRLTRALQNAGQDTANIAGQRIIDRNLNVQPTLTVRQGWRFNVIVSRDLILKPYGDRP